MGIALDPKTRCANATENVVKGRRCGWHVHIQGRMWRRAHCRLRHSPRTIVASGGYQCLQRLANESWAEQ